jgi:hypothetical protein
MAIPKEKKRTPEIETDVEYPYAHKLAEFEDGTFIAVQEKNGKNWFHIGGPSGSYVHINNSGDMIQVATGNMSTTGRSGMSIQMLHNGDIKIEGGSRLLVGTGAQIEVSGDAGVFANTMQAVITGDSNIHCKNAYIGTRENLKMNVTGNMTMEVDGDTTMVTKGTHTIKAKKITMNP